MRTLFLTALFALTSTFCQAQTIQYSIPFPEPDALGCKVFQCTNGNTMFFLFTKSDGIRMTLYDTARRVKAKKDFTGREWQKGEMQSSEIKAIYEIGDQVVLFLQQLIKKKPVLFRLQIDPETGILKKEEKIAEINKYGFGAGYALAVGTDAKTFHVVKDEASDCYAVIRFDGFASSDENRIEAIHFNGNHHEINRAEYKLPAGNDYKYIRYLGLAVDSDRSLFIATYAFDTRSSGGKHSKIFFSKLNTSEKNFIHKPLEMTEDFKETSALLQVIPGTNTLDMLLMTLTERKNKSNILTGTTTTTNYYGLLRVSLDAATMAIIYSRPLELGKLTAYKKNVLKKKDGYGGLPQNIVTHKDRSTTIAFEETITTVQTTGRRSSVGYSMEDIGITELNENGTEQNGYVIRKRHSTGFKIPTFAQHARGNGFMTFDRKQGLGGYAKSGFYSYDMICTENTRYIVYNDHPENFKKAVDEQNIYGVGSISGTHTVCYRLADDKAEKSLLFDKPNSKGRQHFSLINSSHYQPATHTYALMVIEQSGKTKKAKIAWVNFP